MGLPVELLSYAENIYRRFPEEFVALGMPGLEAIFDLRVDGTKSRKITETATEKTVSITMQRWPAGPPGGMSQAHMYGVPQGIPHAPPGAYPYGCGSCGANPYAGFQPPPAGYPQPNIHGGVPSWHQHAFPQNYAPSAQPPPHAPAAPTAPAAASAEDAAARAATNAQLARLESVLALLKPQVEAALAQPAQQAAQQPPPHQQTAEVAPQKAAPSAVQTESRIGAGRPTALKAVKLMEGNSFMEAEADGGTSPLRDRRRMNHLQIGMPDGSVMKQNVVRNGTVKLLRNDGEASKEISSAEEQDKGKQTSAGTGSAPTTTPMGTSVDGQKPAAAKPGLSKPTSQEGPSSNEGMKDRRGGLTISINPMRVAKMVNDPESPRSPGKHSAWK